MKAVSLMIGLLLLVPQLPAQAPYDLLIKGGHVIDPRNGVNRVADRLHDALALRRCCQRSHLHLRIERITHRDP